MVNNPIPILLILAAVSRRGRLPLPQPGAMSPLELEAFLDNARNCINTIDRLNGLARSGPNILSSLGSLGGAGGLSGLSSLAALAGSASSGSSYSSSDNGSSSSASLPDMKKIMEIVENLPL